MSDSGCSKSFLYVVGSDTDRNVVGRDVADVAFDGHTNTYRLRTREPSNFSRVHVTRNFFRQTIRYDLKSGHCIVNLVTDPDQSSKVLRNIEKMLRGYRGPVINHPAAVLRSSRDQMARQLRGIAGLIIPPIVRLQTGKPKIAARKLQEAGMTYPAIVRAAGTHTGTVIGLFDRAEDVVCALDPVRDNYVIGFVDFRSSDGLYRKYRVFFIGERIVLRHLLHSEQWNVHASTRDDFMSKDPELIAEERRLLEMGLSGKVMKTLTKIRDRVKLDFWGIDFALTAEEDILLFEANATMNFFPFSDNPVFDYVKSCLVPAQQAFDGLLYAEDDGAPPALSDDRPADGHRHP